MNNLLIKTAFYTTIVGIVLALDVAVAAEATAVPSDRPAEQSSTATPQNTNAPAPPTANSEIALDEKWYTDSDDDFVPDFIEVELGYDPLVNPCLEVEQTNCVAEYPDLERFLGVGEQLLIILDVSGSMAASLGDQTRMEVAREALLEYVKLLPEETKTGLILYGHQGDNTEAGKLASCEGVEVVADFGEITADSLPNTLAQYNPNGWTPIGKSLSKAASVFAGSEKAINSIILISDGLETCDGNPVQVATTLHNDPDIRLTIDVIGLGVNDSAEQEALSQIAEAGGGEYLTVNDRDAMLHWAYESHDITQANNEYDYCQAGRTLDIVACTFPYDLEVDEFFWEATQNPAYSQVIEAINDIYAQIQLDREQQNTLREEWDTESKLVKEKFNKMHEKLEEARQRAEGQ